MEGALKLKEISYIHAEAYPAGELKHGPLALVDSSMPVIAVAPNDALLEKLKSNLQEVRARGGQLYVFADAQAGFESTPDVHVIDVPAVGEWTAPIVYTVPLQLLAYHVQCRRAPTSISRGTSPSRSRWSSCSPTLRCVGAVGRHLLA